jgi:hypothetical protein
LRFIFIHYFIKKNMNPSLLLIPDRYKAAKLYSQIPDSGAGDLTFARNSNATRVNSAGLIEKVRTNLILQSEAFNEAAWVKTGATITPNATIAPDGTMTADRLVFAAAENFMTQTVGLAATRSYSIYIKGTAGQTISLDDLVVFGPVVTLSGNWDRFNFTSTTGVGLAISTFQGATARDIFIWGAQAELGDITTDYIPTTTAAVSVGITADIPRLDYTGGGCPSLLLEPQRTNLLTYSEQFDNAAWTKNNLTVTANDTISPDGYATADRITETTANGLHDVTQLFTASLNDVISIFAKKDTTRRYVYILTGGGTVLGVYDLELGTVTREVSGVAKIEPAPNGYYRCSLSVSLVGLQFVRFGTSLDGTEVSFVGQAGEGILLWGAQVEAGAYHTSYIPTLGSSVTRLADAASKTGISSLIGQTQGTLYAEFDWVNKFADSVFLTLSDGTTNNRIHFGYAEGMNSFYLYSEAIGVTQVNINTAVPLNGKIKIASAYKLNDYAFYINGSLIAVDSSATVPATSQINVGGFITSGLEQSINTAAIYTTRLTNAELASLTSL